MSVYDKELIINGQAVRSPEQQVYKNMKDIEELKTKLQTWYASSVELTSSDTTILRSNTNVPDDASSGLLIDPNGLMFSITGGDDTTLLITYYASIKGPQGEPGAALNIDDSSTSLTKVWSSQKTSNEIAGIINDSTNAMNKTWSGYKSFKYADKGTFYTITQPTLVGSNYQLATANIENQMPDITDVVIKVNDLVLYIDSDDKVSELYKITNVTASTLTLAKIGDVGGGKQLYQHIISVTENSSAYIIQLMLTIVNDNSTPFTKESINQYLLDNSLDSDGELYPATGNYYNVNAGLSKMVTGIYGESGQTYFKLKAYLTGGSRSVESYPLSGATVTDTVVAI